MDLNAHIPLLERGESPPMSFQRHMTQLNKYDTRVFKIFVPEFLVFAVILIVSSYVFISFNIINFILMSTLLGIAYVVITTTFSKMYFSRVLKECFMIDDTALYAIKYLQKSHQKKIIDILNTELFTITEDYDGDNTKSLNYMRTKAQEKFIEQLNMELIILANKKKRKWVLKIVNIDE